MGGKIHSFYKDFLIIIMIILKMKRASILRTIVKMTRSLSVLEGNLKRNVLTTSLDFYVSICQLSVNILSVCWQSVKWLLIINCRPLNAWLKPGGLILS